MIWPCYDIWQFLVLTKIIHILITHLSDKQEPVRRDFFAEFPRRQNPAAMTELTANLNLEVTGDAILDVFFS